MNAYSSLARFYDSLTDDVPYKAFADFYEELFKRNGLEVKTILDVACGTGTMTRELAERGYELIGADPSPDMLSIAMEKTTEAQVRPVLICQAMEELDLYGTVDAAVCSLDGVNYVHPECLLEAFRRVRMFLEPGGIFIFDVNTPLMLRDLDGEIFLDETDDVFCVWRAEFLPDENACHYGMDVFAKSGKLWTRGREEHIEYAHEPEALRRLLLEAGFKSAMLYGELCMEPPSEDEIRVFVAAVK